MFVSIKKITTMGSRKLRDYFTFDKQIESLQEKLEKEEIGKDVNSFIKSKNKVSNAVENQVIRKIMLENKINELILCKGIIEDVINGYKKFQEHKYKYIIEKFMYCKTDDEVSKSLYMSTATQYKYKVEIAYQISIIALSKNLITIDEIVDERL